MSQGIDGSLRRMRPITTPTMPGLVPASASRHATRRTQVGELEAVYVDTATDEPAFVTVKVGTDGELTGAEEPAVFAHYDLPYTAATAGERRLGRR